MATGKSKAKIKRKKDKKERQKLWNLIKAF